MNDPSSLIERLRVAWEEKDLEKLRLVVEEFEQVGTDIPDSQLCWVVSDIGRLKGYLQNSDSRGWKRSGKTTKEDLIHECNRSLRAIIGNREQPKPILAQDGSKAIRHIRNRRRRRAKVF